MLNSGGKLTTPNSTLIQINQNTVIHEAEQKITGENLQQNSYNLLAKLYFLQNQNQKMSLNKYC